MSTIWETCQNGAGLLTAHGIENAESESRILLCEQLQLSLGSFLLHKADPVSAYDADLFFDHIRLRCRHVPLQHILGKAYFYGLEFIVSPDVLIPRPETEVLVEHALKGLQEGMSVLDLCTGSGCIAITLTDQCPGIRTDASDISPQALAIARKNAGHHHTPVRFIQSDLFEQIHDCYDLIVSNPPYISLSEMKKLMPEVREHDPHLALYGGEDGLDFYRRIITHAPDHLHAGGRLMMEIGADQGAAVSKLLQHNDYTDIQIIRDLNDLDRIVAGRRV